MCLIFQNNVVSVPLLIRPVLDNIPVNMIGTSLSPIFTMSTPHCSFQLAPGMKPKKSVPNSSLIRLPAPALMTIIIFGQNVKMLEVTKENGRSIGTIDFGSRIVKIITDGDIVLKKVEPVKEKVKQKELN